jgi:hypothetical protein
VSIDATEACDNDFGFVGFAITIGVLHEKEIGGICDPNSTVSYGDARWNIEPFSEDGDFIHGTIAIGIFQNLDSIGSLTRFTSWIFEAFGYPDSTLFIEAHGNWINEVWL